MSDLINRQAAMVVIENSGLDDDSKDTVVRVLEQLPSAEPERKTGKWVGIREYCNYLRSLDGKMYVPSGIGIPMKYCNLCWESAESGTNYCPNCGAKMEVDNNV